MEVRGGWREGGESDQGREGGGRGIVRRERGSEEEEGEWKGGMEGEWVTDSYAE